MADFPKVDSGGPTTKFDVPGFAGNSDPTDFADSDRSVTGDAGSLPASTIMTTKHDMAFTVKPNTFPRETGQDSLTEEEAQLT